MHISPGGNAPCLPDCLVPARLPVRNGETRRTRRSVIRRVVRSRQRSSETTFDSAAVRQLSRLISANRIARETLLGKEEAEEGEGEERGTDGGDASFGWGPEWERERAVRGMMTC